MKYIKVAIVAALTLLVVPFLLADTSEDFESYAIGTPASALTTPGVTFTGAPFEIESTNVLGFDLDGQVLFSPTCGTPLTIDFDQPQNSATLDYALVANPFQIEAFEGGTLVSSQTFNGTVVNFFPQGTASVTGVTFDQLVLSAPSASVCLGIDNLNTTAVPTTTPEEPEDSDSGGDGNEEVANHPNTYTGFDGLGSTGFQLADGSQAFYDQTSGIITVNFGSGGTAQYGFPARITDNKDGTLNVFDATGEPVLDRVIITGRNIGTAPGVPAADSAPADNTSNGTRVVTGCQITAGNPLNLRAEPSANSADLGTVPFQTTLGVIRVADTPADPNGPWYQVEYDNTQGWLSGAFLQASGSC